MVKNLDVHRVTVRASTPRPATIDLDTPVTAFDLATRKTTNHVAGDIRQMVRPVGVANAVLSSLATTGEASTGATIWRVVQA